ncbi:hypothetical protein GLAREA_06661 [Glarea lozoyensis ATCC 20868]|uniref:Uncharacterized protein n=1 Tax=Glarea lozoyensis (strain ATCC 20868 / MF5171) TaxID=1116229 RepID=S3E5H5_GLAL2|nr:uncharacterized protein GLAREA_06661 [Glarea lozoyensis ATCC 20868]EPE33648.1 hypothetical protein GLAREA_06661 [Glarea lozoyensis ATCC 20868]
MPFTSALASNASRSYQIAYTVLIGIDLVFVLPFTALAFIKCKYWRDPSREFVNWLKAALVLFAMLVAFSQFLRRASVIIEFLLTSPRIRTLSLLFSQNTLKTYEIYSDVHHWHIVCAQYHVGYLADFSRTTSAAAVMVLLLTLGPGIHRAISGVTSTFDRILRYVTYALAAVVIMLAFVYYGLSVDFQENYTNNIGYVTNRPGGAERVDTINQLMATTSIILWAASLVITGLSIYTFIQRKNSSLKNVSILYLAASLLNIISSTWNFTYAIEWLLQWDVRSGQEPYVMLLSIILGWWTRGILLILSYFVANKRVESGGIWSSTKSFRSV